MRFMGKGLALLMLLWLQVAVVWADQKGMDYPHNSTTGTGCNSCHYMQGDTIPLWVTQPRNGDDLDDTLYNNSCWSCHNGIERPTLDTHSNQTDQAVDKYGAKWSIECRTCHWPHHQKQLRMYKPDSYIVSGVSSEVTTYTLKKTGANWAVDAYKGMILIPDTTTTQYKYTYQYKITGNTSDTITVKSAIDAIVKVSGKTFAVIYGKLLKSTITTPNSGDKTVKFFRPTGANSFADGVGAYDGVCEVCHTKTTHYRNDGSGSDQSHANVGGGQNGSNCMGCHPHTGGMKHGGGGGSGCGDASSCHGLQNSHPAHVVSGGNVSKECSTCHNTNNFPSFKSGTDANHNSIIELSETDVCNECHHDGTAVATAVVVPVAPPAWDSGQSIGCNGCHNVGPSYGNGTPKANSHAIHGAFSCDKCHYDTTTNSTSISDRNRHPDAAYSLKGGNGVTFSYAFSADGGTCSNISCHGQTSAKWGSKGCLGCHAATQGSRAAITSQFSGNSHHVQGVAIANSHCYQCHWEANSDGSINATYHGGGSSSGAPVNLVLYGAGVRPTTYNNGYTGIAYTANGSRSEIVKINLHCLSCHSDQNNDSKPFGDCNTPRQYAWDRNSIAARYSQTDTTAWGKYSNTTYPKIAAKNLMKSFSAHGNAMSNQGGFDPATGLDAAIANTRGGFANVLCFDCHNAHGSVSGGITSSYISFNGSQNGGLLKNTVAGKGGYTVSYIPQANTDVSDQNPYNTGAALCFDCHMTATTGQTPWGYQQTFGALKPIMGYRDGHRFGTSYSGTKQRFSYRAGRTNRGGHMMASASLKGLNGSHEGNEALYPINGLCTPCHDPHGISPSLGANQSYGVPLLKGTWLTSPYKEDSPEMTGTASTDGCQSSCTQYDDTHDRHWNTDRVTFDKNNNIHDTGGKITEGAEIFAGLCLRCHPKANLTDGTNKNTAWKTVDRIHETVNGWGSNQEHTFPCSKCHVPHNSGLPRLMQTNCLDFNHRKQALKGGVPSYAGNPNYGNGFFPGRAVRTVDPLSLGGCHEVSQAKGGGGPFTGGNTWPFVELWNEVTPW